MPKPEDKRPGLAALEAVEAFCKATTLKERLPLIETSETEVALLKTCLNQPLPEFTGISPQAQEPVPEEKMTEFYFRVKFKNPDGSENHQTILARKRGDAAPRVVVRPFLDQFGGRLAEFTKNPVNTGAEFQAFIYAQASCTNEDVQGRENKLTLILLSGEGREEIARAYFGKNSAIGQMLANSDAYGFSYGAYKPATVYLTWNENKGGKKPYLEALQIKSLDWNP